MFLLLFLPLLSSVYVPSKEEKARRWDSLNRVGSVPDDDGLQLVFVNAMWRHGDRAATLTMPGDVLNEGNWTFGGGGYGELSPIGMSQHMNLGLLLRKMYVTDTPFLSMKYNSREIYVRSTDKNRTIISAYSNLIGMYSTQNDTNDVNLFYPSDASWPSAYIPIAIHTNDQAHDHVADPDAPCMRQDQLWDLAHQTDEYISYDQSDFCQDTLKYLRNATNSSDDAVTFDNIYIIWDNILCETVHFPDNVNDWYPWYTPIVHDRTQEINDRNIDLQNGIFIDGVIDGLDLTIEIPKIRGGPLLKDVYSNAMSALNCWRNSHLNDGTECGDDISYMNKRKYYAISGHDTTIAAYLTVLGAKSHVVKSPGYSSYSSSVITEFYVNTTSEAKTPLFRLLYHDNADSNPPFTVITAFVDGCPLDSDYCNTSVLKQLSDKFDPGDIYQLCDTPIKATE